jgi:hypothetical protein
MTGCAALTCSSAPECSEKIPNCTASVVTGASISQANFQEGRFARLPGWTLGVIIEIDHVEDPRKELARQSTRCRQMAKTCLLLSRVGQHLERTIPAGGATRRRRGRHRGIGWAPPPSRDLATGEAVEVRVEANVSGESLACSSSRSLYKREMVGWGSILVMPVVESDGTGSR